MWLRIAALAALSGCSLFAVHGPGAPGEPCTTSSEIPWLDLATAGALGLLAGADAVRIHSDNCNNGEGRICGPYTTSYAILAAGGAFLVSSLVGWERVGSCQEVKARERAGQK